MSTDNDELVRSSFDAFLRGDWDALARVMAPDVQRLWYEPGDWDCHDRMEIVDLIAEGEKVVGRFRCSATHLGPWRGHPPAS